MSIKVTRTGNGISNLVKEISRVRKFEPMLKEIGQSLESSTKLRFNTSTDPEGKPWKERSEIYKAKLKKIGKLNNKILVLSTQLLKSISHAFDSNDVNIGTDKSYAKVHQEGGPTIFEWPGEKPVEIVVPARPYLGISQKDEQEIERIVQKHVEG